MLATVQIHALKPAARPFKVPDSDGLFLLVQPSGALLWRFRYKAFGVERKLSLGAFPDVTLQQARRLRDQARSEIIDGIDPVAEKRQKRIEAELAAKTTFELVANEYIQKMEREGRAPPTIKKARWFLELLADIANWPIASITPHELLDVLKRVEKRGHHETEDEVIPRGSAFAAGSLHPPGFALARSSEFLFPAKRHIHRVLGDRAPRGPEHAQ